MYWISIFQILPELDLITFTSSHQDLTRLEIIRTR